MAIDKIFLSRQLAHIEAFFGICQAWGGVAVLYLTCLQEPNPLIEVRLRHLVEVVDAQEVILRKDVACLTLRFLPVLECVAEEHLALAIGELQDVVRVVQALEHGLAVVHIVLRLTEGEIHDVDGIHLAYLLIVLAYVDVVGDDLRHAIEDAVEVSQLTVVLNLEDGELALLVLGKDVHTVELVVFVFLIGLALKEAHDGELLVQQRSHQSFEHGMVCLVAQQAFHRPIKANQICNFRLIFNVLLILLLEIYSFP